MKLFNLHIYRTFSPKKLKRQAQKFLKRIDGKVGEKITFYEKDYEKDFFGKGCKKTEALLVDIYAYSYKPDCVVLTIKRFRKRDGKPFQKTEQIKPLAGAFFSLDEMQKYGYYLLDQ